MICPNCKNKILEGDKFCAYCGQKLEIKDETHETSKTPETPKLINSYGAFWPRFGVYFVDLTLILVVLIILVLLFGISWDSEWDNIVGFIALIVYHISYIFLILLFFNARQNAFWIESY